MGSYVFARPNKFKLRRPSGSMVEFFRHPALPVVPLIALAFHDVVLELTVVDEAGPIPSIACAYAFLQDAPRRALAQRSLVLNRFSGAPVKISQGMASLVSQNQVSHLERGELGGTVVGDGGDGAVE